MSGAHYRQSTRRTRGRLARSHSVSDTTTSQQESCLLGVEEKGSSKETNPDREEDGGHRGERVRRPMSARRLRLTSSFDDGCLGRERVSSFISSTTAGSTSTAMTSSSCSVNTDGTQRLGGSSTSNQSQKPRLRSSSAARIGMNRTASSSTSCLGDQPRSNALKSYTKGQKESGMSAKHTDRDVTECSTTNNIAKKVPNVSSQRDTTSSKRPPPRASLPPVRRTSLDTKSYDSDKPSTGRQPNAPPSGPRDQRNCKVGVRQSGTLSANSSPRLTRTGGLQPSANHTARYRCLLSF